MDQAFAPEHLPQPPSATARLLLRPYEDADADDAHEALDRDEDVWRFDPGYAPALSHRLANIRRYAALHEHFGFGPAAAFLREGDGTLIGQGGLNPYVYDHRDGSRTVEFEVMYKLRRSAWGQGCATELASFWLDFAFREVRLPRVIVCPEKANVASLRVLERLGAEFEDDWLDQATVIASFSRARWLADVVAGPASSRAPPQGGPNPRRPEM